MKNLRTGIARIGQAVQPTYRMPVWPMQMTASLVWAIYPLVAGTSAEFTQRADAAMSRTMRAWFSPQARRASLAG